MYFWQKYDCSIIFLITFMVFDKVVFWQIHFLTKWVFPNSLSALFPLLTKTVNFEWLSWLVTSNTNPPFNVIYMQIHCNMLYVITSNVNIWFMWSFCKFVRYSQTCVPRPPLGPEKRGHYAEGCLKKISGK